MAPGSTLQWPEEIAINKSGCLGSLKIKDNLKEFVNTSLEGNGVLPAF